VSDEQRQGGRDPSGDRPPVRTWRARLDDPAEPLYTVGVAADLLGVDAQTVRRVEGAVAHSTARPSGNQRRYSRRDLEVIDAAIDLSRQGYPPQAFARLLELERQIGELADRGPSA
jgi:MerR family transcriptional regulator, heat shock protein HspR